MSLLRWRAFTLAGSGILKYIGDRAVLIIRAVQPVVEACFGPLWMPTTSY